MIRILMLASLLVAAPALAKKNEPSPAELAATHGLVTARLHGTLPDAMLGVPGSMPASLGLRPAGGDEKGRDEEHLFQRLDDPDSFGGWLPAGRYRMSSWRLTAWENGPEFEVVAGRITDLGDLLEVSLGGYDVVLLPLEHPEIATRLDPWHAEVDAVLVSPEPLRWKPAEMPAPITIGLQSTAGMFGGGLLMDLMLSSQRKAHRGSDRARLREIRDIAEFQARALEAMPPTRDDGAVDGEGRIHFGADFGRVRVREADGRWRTLDTGTLADITAVEWRDGRLLAGSKDGVVRVSDDDGRTWRVLRRFDRNEAVTDIDRVGDRWFVVTTHLEAQNALTGLLNTRSTVYAGAAEDLSDLAEQARYPQKIRGMLATWKPSRGEMSGEYYFVNAYPDLQRLHLPTGEWTSLKVPGNTELVMVSPRTGALTAVSGNVYLSIDQGKKWMQLATPKGTSAPSAAMMHDTAEGWLASWYNDSLVTSLIIQYDRVRGGGGWNKLGETPLGCGRVLRDAAGEPTLCTTVSGAIVRRDGADWVAEFAVE